MKNRASTTLGKTTVLRHSTGTAGGRDGLDPVDVPGPTPPFEAADEGSGRGVGEALEGALDGPPNIILPIPFE
jgi:hypothetical protein